MPEELSDHSGRIRWRAAYKAWGNTLTEQWTCLTISGHDYKANDQDPQAQASTLPQNLRFQGQYLDRDTGLHYNTFRFYDPDIGRFISPDPIGLNGGMNLHAYGNNPISWIDPWGLEQEPIRIYEDAPYHGKTDNSVKSRAPTNGQTALDNSVQVKSTSPRRVGVDAANNEIVVIDRTQVNADGSELYHGHVRDFPDLHPDQQNALKKAGMVDKKGNIKAC